jgi:hypothetical protein
MTIGYRTRDAYMCFAFLLLYMLLNKRPAFPWMGRRTLI